MTLDKVWITGFNGKILPLDFDGRPVGKESEFPLNEKFLGLRARALLSTEASGLQIDRAPAPMP